MNVYLTVAVDIKVRETPKDVGKQPQKEHRRTNDAWPDRDCAVELSIVYEGDSAATEGIPRDESNLIWASTLHVLEAEAKKSSKGDKTATQEHQRTRIAHVKLTVRNEVRVGSLSYKPLTNSMKNKTRFLWPEDLAAVDAPRLRV